MFGFAETCKAAQLLQLPQNYFMQKLYSFLILETMLLHWSGKTGLGFNLLTLEACNIISQRQIKRYCVMQSQKQEWRHKILPLEEVSKSLIEKCPVTIFHKSSFFSSQQSHILSIYVPLVTLVG